MKIRTVLIANRGEIACRIARTASRLGIRTVAVFSEPDRHSLHVAAADEAIALGGFESRDSYLKIDAIIAAAKRCGADAVHPGYGFLSENPLFAEALERSGIKLIGPSSKTMRALGDKIRAKELAARCNVPTVPSLILETAGASGVKKIAAFGERAGYPLLIKASAGGGGRGMRRIESVKEIRDAVASASREAEAFFGDGRIFVEKLILHPRHIEVQLLGDSKGAVTHLYDRDCTLQRRHQKVIEEAPAPRLSPRLRAEILSSAARLAEAARYENAGTAEFLIDDSGGFYFLEVNSRLQVEHPVTEEHTGLDLVELQIGVAEGKSLDEILPTPSSVPERKNVAIEVRICAEDPERDFAPSTGRIEHFSIPDEDGIRIESGVSAGSIVRHYYDPLIAKVVATGEDREDARLKLLAALERSAITGIATNIPYLTRLLQSTQFISCSHDTKIAESFARVGTDDSDRLRKIAAIWNATRVFSQSEGDSWSELKGFRITPAPARFERIRIRGSEFRVETTGIDRNAISCKVSHETASGEHAVRLESSGERFITVSIDGEEILLRYLPGPSRDWIIIKGESFEILPRAVERGERSSQGSNGTLTSPLPGKVLRSHFKRGSAIKAGEPVFTIESMKMEHAILAPRSGTLAELCTAPGKIVDAGTVLGRITASSKTAGKRSGARSRKKKK